MNSLSPWLRNSSIFQRLPDETLDKVAERLQPRHLPQGTLLFNINDPGDELFVVQSGGVGIFAPNPERPGEEPPIRVFRPGDVLGEMALIDRQPRSLSARAVETTDVLVLEGPHFRALLSEDPSLALAVMGGLSDRIRYTTEFLNEVRQWVRQVASQNFAEVNQQVPLPANKLRDESLITLAAEFAQMAMHVQKREQALRQEIAQLRIEIDETKKQRDVASVVESDYFQSLKQRSQSLRKARHDPESPPKTE